METVPICFEDVKRHNLVNCYVAGWGQTLHDPHERRLKEARMKIIHRYSLDFFALIPNFSKLCQRHFAGNFFPRKQLCAKSQSRRHPGLPCHGDSGGPLICQHKVSKKWFLTGIISWGADNCDVQKPTVFTKVRHYTDFIKNHF